MSGGAARQTTLGGPAEGRGVALHSGTTVRLRLRPAPAEEGIVFIRTDLAGAPRIAARPERVKAEALQRRTELEGENGATVATVEHLLAACLGMGLDNVYAELDGPEVPIFDGSARPFVEMIREARLEDLPAARRTWRLQKPVALVEETAEIIAVPARRMELAFFADLRRAGLLDQSATLTVGEETFEREIAPARTFVFFEQLEHLREAGLIRGGSLDCAIVIRDGEPVQTEYRLANELAAHKLLDFLGDLAILGRPVEALITARGSGHALHHAFIQRLLGELIE